MSWNDGTIEFWGREAFQVKIRGHRIELGEIEAAVNQSHLVKEAAAMAVKVKGKPSLAAAIVPIDGSYPEEEILADEMCIRDSLYIWLAAGRFRPRCQCAL